MKNQQVFERPANGISPEQLQRFYVSKKKYVFVALILSCLAFVVGAAAAGVLVWYLF